MSHIIGYFEFAATIIAQSKYALCTTCLCFGCCEFPYL